MEQPGATALGRERELASIDAWLAGFPARPRPRLPVIAGEPGIGKTTLWSEAAARARALGYQVLSSRPVP
jgi:predicted ATPase